MRRTIRNSKLLVFGLASACILVMVAYLAYQHVTETVRDAYAVWWVGDTVVEYLETHDRHWPQSWDDLRPSYEALCAKIGGAPWSFEELRTRVEIDFAADPDQLAKVDPETGERPFRVIYLKDGRDVSWEGAEPNTIVWKYLSSQKQ